MTIKDFFGDHPQRVWYYVRLIGGTFRTMLDVGMFVTGIWLVYFGLRVLLDGFGLIDVGYGLGTGAMLASSSVIMLLGGFALGISSEGGYGAQESVRDLPSGEVAVGRVIGGYGVTWILLQAHERLGPFVDGLPEPFAVAHELLGLSARGGLLMAFIGPLLAFGFTVLFVWRGWTRSTIKFEYWTMVGLWALIVHSGFSAL